MGIEKTNLISNVTVELINPKTKKSLGFIVVNIREDLYRSEMCDGYTKEECEKLEYSKDVLVYAQIASGVGDDVESGEGSMKSKGEYDG